MSIKNTVRNLLTKAVFFGKITVVRMSSKKKSSGDDLNQDERMHGGKSKPLLDFSFRLAIGNGAC